MSSQKTHIAVKVIQGAVLAFIILLIATCLLFQLPSVQTRTARRVAEMVGGGINGDITIGGLSIVFFNRVTLRDVTVRGHGAPAPWGESDTCRYSNPGDTLGHVGKLSVSFRLMDLMTGRLGVHRVVLEDGFFRLLMEDSLHRSNLNRIFGLPIPDPSTPHAVFPDLFANDIKLKRCGFSLGDPYNKLNEHPALPGQMQYNNLRIKNITAHFKNLKTVNGEVSCRILELSAKESSGAAITMMKGNLHLGPRGSGMEDLYLEEGSGSVIRADNLDFIYSGRDEVADWVNSVVMDVNFRESAFTFSSIRFFVPSMADNHLSVNIHGGSVKGPVSDMDVKNLHVTLPEGRTSVKASAVIKGIPDMPNTYIEGSVSDLLTTADMEKIAAKWCGHPVRGNLSGFARGETITQNVSVKGPFRDLSVNGTFGIGGGSLTHRINIGLFSDAGFSAGGEVAVDSLDLGMILGIDALGKTDLDLKGSFLTGKTSGINLEYLDVRRFGFNGYDYSRIAASGHASDSLFSIWMVSRDPNLKLELSADARFEDDARAGQYDVDLSVPFVDLEKLNLITGIGRSQISGIRAALDMRYDGEDNAVGRMTLRNLLYTNRDGSLLMDSLVVNSSFRDSQYAVKLNSPFIEVSYSGGDPLLSAVFRTKDILVDRQFSHVLAHDAARPDQISGHNDSLSIRTRDFWKVTHVITDGIYLADGSSFVMNLSDTDSLEMDFNSSRVAMKRNYLRNVMMHVDNPDSSVRVSMNSSEVRLGEFIFKDNVLNVLSSGGQIGLNYDFHGNDKGRYMNFSSDIAFQRDENGLLQTKVGLDRALLYLDDKMWELDSSRVVIGHEYYGVDGFRFHSGRQSLTGQGVLSDNPEDHLMLKLDSLDISVVNTFLADNMNLSGTLSGTVDIWDIFHSPDFLVDIKGSDGSFYGHDLGQLRVMSKPDLQHERVNLLFTSRLKGKSPINLTGYYVPQDRRVFLNASLDELSVSYAEPFLKDVMSIDGGSLSGNIVLYGRQGHYGLTSENASFADLKFTPLSTGVPYIVNGNMKFTADTIVMDSVKIEDPEGHHAVLSGSLAHDFFKDMKLDMKMAFKDLKCLDIKETPEAAVYGTAYASGVASVTGPVNDILVSGTVRTGPGTRIHVPITNAYAASSNDILVFKDYARTEVDPYDSLMNVTPKTSGEKAKVRLKASATVEDDAAVLVELDRNLGNIVECYGSAKVNLFMDPSESITDIKGYYKVTKGEASYVFAGVIARDFSINEGGTITFRGPISATQLDVGATYKTRTSISGLIADTSSVSTRQTVYASVGLKGGLDNPKFSFGIDIPDVDPLTRGRVETALSTDAKVQQQFMALMLTGSFIQSEQSGVTDNSNILYSNVSEMISNRMNSVLRTLNVPLDVGLNYQRSGNRKDMIDVNLSYQAFNNRLILTGSVNNSNRYSNWGGNFEAELKMDRKGKFRFSLFTRAADQYTNYLDYSQRSGFGFSFQDEFTRFSEIFMSGKKKEAMELEKVEKARKELLEGQTQSDGSESEEQEADR